MADRQGETWAIIGASRGLGHMFVQQLLDGGHQVLASLRSLPETAASLWPNHDGRCSVYDCDMLSEKSIAAFADKLGREHNRIDCVVLNAGVLRHPNRATELSYDDFAFHLHTNTIGPIICAQRLLKAGISIGKIVFISSDSGSAQRFLDFEDGFAAYSASKAALNQALRHMAAELQRKGSDTIVLALHPGEVNTDMAKNVSLEWEVEGQMTPAESVTACTAVIRSKGKGDSGTFWTWENEPYPW
ncbi:related to protoporphyrinogen oxidase [Ramularia collo-cygni]|uniref:Related to protoporphyrinogen oxidase n=1 Tax=Ramularia collo-cygni TaxID=112498 RepID=A0A2D3UX12_9PEZI|nr:related to protoporphyrinogen oxidase [Ramularia collo-cygni]CZT22372.1 related to protoporphyrinogen oxidase [Ramularia collo-cygni]